MEMSNGSMHENLKCHPMVFHFIRKLITRLTFRSYFSRPPHSRSVLYTYTFCMRIKGNTLRNIRNFTVIKITETTLFNTHRLNCIERMFSYTLKSNCLWYSESCRLCSLIHSLTLYHIVSCAFALVIFTVYEITLLFFWPYIKLPLHWQSTQILQFYEHLRSKKKISIRVYIYVWLSKLEDFRFG